MPAISALQLRSELLTRLIIARSLVNPVSRRSPLAFWLRALDDDDDDDDDNDNLIKEVEKAEKAKEMKNILSLIALNHAASNAAPSSNQVQGASQADGAAGASPDAGTSTALPASTSSVSATSSIASSTASSTETSAAQATKEGSNESAGVVTSGNKGLHPGAIAGIVIGSVFLVVIIVVLIYRRSQQQKRLKRRTWAIKPYEFDDAQGLAEKGDGPRTTYAASSEMIQTGNQPIAAMANPWNPEPINSSTGTPFVLAKPPPGGKGMKKKQPSTRGGSISSTKSTINLGDPRSNDAHTHSRSSSVSTPVPSVSRPPSLMITIPTPMPGMAATNPDHNSAVSQSTIVPAVTHGSNVRIVKYSYMPTRDDELAVELGDELKIVKQFDDGWAMCMKLSTDAQGMVPMACWEDDDGSESEYEEDHLKRNKPTKMLARGTSLRK